MYLFPWRKLAQALRRNSNTANLQRLASTSSFFRYLWLEQLEDRTLLTTYQWVGGAVGNPTSWSTPANWSPNTGFPSLPSDVAQFTGTYTAAQTATIDVPNISVGEIDFGTTQNVTITNSGGNILTLNNGTAAAILNTLTRNSGTDTISAPITQAGNLNVTFSGGSLDSEQPHHVRRHGHRYLLRHQCGRRRHPGHDRQRHHRGQ